jgi:hypothetical protein
LIYEHHIHHHDNSVDKYNINEGKGRGREGKRKGREKMGGKRWVNIMDLAR